MDACGTGILSPWISHSVWQVRCLFWRGMDTGARRRVDLRHTSHGPFAQGRPHSGLDISINISKQISWLSLAFSYDALLASALSLHNSHTHTIAPGLARTTGFKFAQGDYSGAVWWGETAAQHTRWISNTTMALRVVRGLARS